MGAHALILNASYEPLHVVSWQRAIQLLFQGKVEVVEESEHEIRTVRITIKIPSVLRLINYIPRLSKRQVIRFSRENIFIRDNYQCQYCGKSFHKAQLTLDHVTPVVKGGGKSWENIVTSCKPCNQKKGGRTPPQAQMHLVKRPKEPQWLPRTTIQLSVSVTPEKWKLYLTRSKADD